MLISRDIRTDGQNAQLRGHWAYKAFGALLLFGVAALLLALAGRGLLAARRSAPDGATLQD